MNDGSCDVNLCKHQLANCSSYATCNKTASYEASCTCNDGFIGPGFRCDDVDECLVDRAEPAPVGATWTPKPRWGGCHHAMTCQNSLGGHSCGVCPDGYMQNGTMNCLDKDECLVEQGGCGTLAPCINLDGNHTCGPCPSGYSGNAWDGCLDVDECVTSPCQHNSTCLNLIGRFICHCLDGWGGQLCEISVRSPRPPPSLYFA